MVSAIIYGLPKASSGHLTMGMIDILIYVYN